MPAAPKIVAQFLGDQLPIVVAPADAFPTPPNLPGPPFAPAGATDIAAPLRESRAVRFAAAYPLIDLDARAQAAFGLYRGSAIHQRRPTPPTSVGCSPKAG